MLYCIYLTVSYIKAEGYCLLSQTYKNKKNQSEVPLHLESHPRWDLKDFTARMQVIRRMECKKYKKESCTQDTIAL